MLFVNVKGNKSRNHVLSCVWNHQNELLTTPASLTMSMIYIIIITEKQVKVRATVSSMHYTLLPEDLQSRRGKFTIFFGIAL